MKTLRYFFLLFFLNALCFFAFAQKQNIKFAHLDISSGLSQSNVLCIFQDSRGFMWFGTPDGLNKYDSYSFTVYKKDLKKPGSLSNNYIRDIIEDKNGDLWLATWGGGLNRYNRQKDEFTHYKYNQLNANSISGDFSGDFLKDSESKIRISTGPGIDVSDPKKNRFFHYKNCNLVLLNPIIL